MPAFGPIKRNNLIRYVRKAGFERLFCRSRHQIMVKDIVTVVIPNLHKSDISKGLLAAILKEAGVSREEWEKL